MEYELTVQVSEELRRQAAELAAARGATVENLVREAIAQYVNAQEAELIFAHVSAEPRTELGARLRKLRDQIMTDEAPLLEWEELRRELAERRGELDNAAPDLR